VLAIFERRHGRLGSKISGYGQLAEMPVYFMSGLPPEADTNRKGRHGSKAVILTVGNDFRSSQQRTCGDHAGMSVSCHELALANLIDRYRHRMIELSANQPEETILGP
jgi:hypothetical protein